MKCRTQFPGRSHVEVYRNEVSLVVISTDDLAGHGPQRILLLPGDVPAVCKALRQVARGIETRPDAEVPGWDHRV
jgi:hypothetical protein